MREGMKTHQNFVAKKNEKAQTCQQLTGPCSFEKIFCCLVASSTTVHVAEATTSAADSKGSTTTSSATGIRIISFIDVCSFLHKCFYCL